MGANLKTLLALVKQLYQRCPWTKQQTHESIMHYTLEEAYEVVDAIEQDDSDALCDELGDLLYHVLLHSEMAESANKFDFSDVIDACLQKRISRNQRLLDSEYGLSLDEVKQDWQQCKQAERDNKAHHGVLADVPNAMPALQRAKKLQQRAATVGFDWPGPEPVYDKVTEELNEVSQANTIAEREEEVGDLLFACVNLARHYDIDPEIALRKANQKFINRFQKLEVLAGAKIKSLKLNDLEKLWQQVK